jgi:hypothetical protein
MIKFWHNVFHIVNRCDFKNVSYLTKVTQPYSKISKLLASIMCIKFSHKLEINAENT